MKDASVEMRHIVQIQHHMNKLMNNLRWKYGNRVIAPTHKAAFVLMSQELRNLMETLGQAEQEEENDLLPS